MQEEILNNIKKISEANPEEEVCGFWVSCKKQPIIQCKNVALDRENNFEISAEEYINTFNTKNIILLFHSHPKGTEKFSKEDLYISQQLEMPILVYSNATKKFNFYKPDSIRKNKTLNAIEKSVVTY